MKNYQKIIGGNEEKYKFYLYTWALWIGMLTDGGDSQQHVLHMAPFNVDHLSEIKSFDYG